MGITGFLHMVTRRFPCIRTKGVTLMETKGVMLMKTIYILLMGTIDFLLIGTINSLMFILDLLLYMGALNLTALFIARPAISSASCHGLRTC